MVAETDGKEVRWERKGKARSRWALGVASGRCFHEAELFWSASVAHWLESVFCPFCFPLRACVLTWSFLIVSFVRVEKEVLRTLSLRSSRPAPRATSFISLMCARASDVG